MLAGVSMQKVAGMPPELTLCLQLALLFGLVWLQVTEKATQRDLGKKENLNHVPEESKC